MNEFAIEWTRDRDFATVTTPPSTALQNKLTRLSEMNPNEVTVEARNKDGSAVFHVPVNYIKISPPRKVSEEQKEAAAERFRRMWEEKKEMENNERSN